MRRALRLAALAILVVALVATRSQAATGRHTQAQVIKALELGGVNVIPQQSATTGRPGPSARVSYVEKITSSPPGAQ
jgi:hypothetical protein